MAVYEKGSDGLLKLKEHHLYGSSRLGIVERSQNMDLAKVDSTIQPLLGSMFLYPQYRGHKRYELSNHLGNVLATVSDKKLGIDSDNNGSIDAYEAEVVSAQDYYPFGLMI